ncbi:unnamed protein product [Caenorhabditis angaria]|uniref:28S ribosomal protein S27, mitochondrial n=1 Tax=Caenorhabditis angaria TaxID=860376 RepID=A0A9P1MTK3_9PELO|nr:unnamed protein product [Caenorhabditis angaria]
MLSSRVIRSLAGPRSLNRFFERKILTPAFSLEKEWAARHEELAKLGLGGDYEWISAVQKKFIGGGYASAVDVDAAICVAEQKDQVDDTIELLYKLRHSVKAAEKADSSEYAIIRLLLKYQPDIIFTLANDSINYGVFLNEHSACLVIDHFLKTNNIQGAARIVSWVMQQEQTENELLNLLGLYVCSKWVELPIDQQTMPLAEENDEDVNEDDIRTFKFPYLKNEYFDEHFDLNNAQHLVGKSILWISRDSKTLSQEVRNDLQFLGAILFEKSMLAESLASPKISNSVKNLVKQRLLPKEEGAEMTENSKKILEKLGEFEENQEGNQKLSEVLGEALKKIQGEEEAKLCGEQKRIFGEWNERRRELSKAQAEKVLLRVREEEIVEELKKLDKMEEQMNFFQKSSKMGKTSK